MYTCNVCKEGGVEPFTAPADPVGAELMKAHLKDKHNVDI